MKNRPNIFDIATKELSQDAFITWLLQFANEDFRSTDELLNECGKSFVTKLIQKQIPNFNERISKVVAGTQWEKIDIWAEVNDKYLIIIEDKTYTSHHSDQLTRYKTTAEKWCIDNKFEKPICIYLKTGNQSQKSLSKVQEQGFSIFGRTDFIQLLAPFKDTSNNIFTDFYERLTRIEKSNNEFEVKALKDWEANDWQGFFQFLESHLQIENWDYVNNPSGGFWNAVLNWEEWENFPVYIQLEQDKLCFKISTDPDEVDIPESMTRAEIRNQLHDLILNKANDCGLKDIRSPHRFGNGKYMTVAVVDRENWLGADNDCLDKDAVIKTLTEYLNFLDLVLYNKSDAKHPNLD